MDLDDIGIEDIVQEDGFDPEAVGGGSPLSRAQSEREKDLRARSAERGGHKPPARDLSKQVGNPTSYIHDNYQRLMAINDFDELAKVLRTIFTLHRGKGFSERNSRMALQTLQDIEAKGKNVDELQKFATNFMLRGSGLGVIGDDMDKIDAVMNEDKCGLTDEQAAFVALVEDHFDVGLMEDELPPTWTGEFWSKFADFADANAKVVKEWQEEGQAEQPATSPTQVSPTIKTGPIACMEVAVPLPPGYALNEEDLKTFITTMQKPNYEDRSAWVHDVITDLMDGIGGYKPALASHRLNESGTAIMISYCEQ